jgi:hypothetical protein
MTKSEWDDMCGHVADTMKLFTRPYVTILAGGSPNKPTEVGTGTFIDKSGVGLLTCEHVARFKPTAYYQDSTGSTDLDPGPWRTEPDPNKDVALASVPAAEWAKVAGRARPLPMVSFAARHAPVEHELLFFRGIAGENTYISSFGADAIISGYCSQEKPGTGDANIFEILWKPSGTTVTPATGSEIKGRFKYDDPHGFSGSLVWNTRFVETGCDVSTWHPNQAVVTGLLRRFDDKTDTLLAWRVEHLQSWL